MDGTTEMRPGEEAASLPETSHAAVYFIGRARTPWKSRTECPRQGDAVEGPLCRIEIELRWRKALKGLAPGGRLQVLYWMHEARRDLVVQHPRGGGEPTGTFGLRSPNRPNPIASSLLALVGIEDGGLIVRGFDCVDGTPVLDIKPELCPHA